MNRLTTLDKYGDYIFIDGANVCPNEVAVKLGHLEDIEQELGCPLEVVFKALKNGAYIIEDAYMLCLANEEEKEQILNSTPEFNYVVLNYDDTDYELRFGCEYIYSVKLKDYQKTWWLKNPKEEK